jgi:hypothetical protein
MWDRGLVHNQLCGCGVPFRDCAFWRAVFTEAFGGFERVDGPALMALTQEVCRTRYVPWMVLGGRAGYRERLEEYTATLARLYRAIRDVSGCRVILDSSKEPAWGFILNTLPDVELSVVHLVRDSRAVAYSWLKKKRLPDVHWKAAYMHRYSPLGSALLWMSFNAMSHGYRLAGRRYVRVFYEDFTRDPSAVLARIVGMLGESGGYGFVDGRRLTLRADHTASGNPVRFEVGTLEVRADEEWRIRMFPADRKLVTRATWPLLFAYGYVPLPTWRGVARRRVRHIGT